MKVKTIGPCQLGTHGHRHANEIVNMDYTEFLAQKTIGNVAAVDAARDMIAKIAKALGLPMSEPEPVSRLDDLRQRARILAAAMDAGKQCSTRQAGV